MTKTDLVRGAAEAGNISKTAAEAAVQSVFDQIASSLAAGEAVAIPGFGTFGTSQRAARTGRNPRTGESIAIAASTVVTFKARKGLKDAVNK